MNKLNPRQFEAVHYISNPLLVLAGAGSGKTSVITRKISYLIETCDIKAYHIAAVTFTNKAAREMKERVGKRVKGKASQGLIVSTFHTLGLNIIRREHELLGFKPGFSIFDSYDSMALLKDLMLKDISSDEDDVKSVQQIISNWKNDLVEPNQALDQVETPLEQLAAQVYISYDRSLQAYNAVDFDDLILIPVILFRRYPEVLEKWQNRIRYLLVDEYQDTNTSQYLLVKMLVGPRGALTVVGDDDQSIYAWRGARPQNMSLLKEDYPNLKIIKLEQNYRSTSTILKSANQLIANNPHEFTKELWSGKGHGDPIRIVVCPNDDDETERIAMEITNRHLTRGLKFCDFAILYRSNHQSRILEIKLQAQQIPYQVHGGTSFFTRTEIKDVMAYLRLLINVSDDSSFLRIINIPRRQIGPSIVEKLGAYASDRKISLFAACGEMGLEQLLNAPQMDKLRRFKHWIETVAENCQRQDPVQILTEMIKDMDYEGWVYKACSNPRAAEKTMENVWYLIKSIQKTLEKAEENNEEASIEQAIGKLILQDLMEQQDENEITDKVQLMTLHASKGLEFPHVYIMGMEEELLPHRNSIDTGDVEEERRLAYVGITRAQETLTFTLSAQRKSYGENLNCTPSRFLQELPTEDLTWEGNRNEDPAILEARKAESLNGLKSIFPDDD